jgi:hypothetical protein
MKKFLALTAVAALFTGCDFAGGADGPAVAFAGMSVNDLQVAADVTPVVEIQDITGRAYYQADVTPGASLPAFEIGATQRDLFVVLLDRDGAEEYSFVAVSPAFVAGELTGDTALELRTRAGAAVGSAALDLQ